MKLGTRSAVSLSDDWATEQWLFDYLDALYGPFQVDTAASRWNTKCALFFTERQDALKQRWPKYSFTNCPYSAGNKLRFTRHGRLHVKEGSGLLSCHVLPHDTSDGYWRTQVRAAAGELLGVTAHRSQLGWVTQTCWKELTVEVTEIDGRLHFTERTGATGTARHSSAIVVFARPGLLEPLEWNSPRSRIPTYRPSRRLEAA